MEFTNWLLSFSIPREVLETLIIIPLLATLISMGRYIIGFKTLGIYAPIILAIGFKLTGFRYGIVLTFLVVIASLIGYRLLSRFRMHYITRVAANYALISILLISGIITFDSITFLGLTNFDMINPIGVVLIAALSDFFIKMYVKKNLSISLRSLAETILISTIGWYLISSPKLVDLFFRNLWILPILIAFNLFLGQYKGFRFKELFRFKSIPNELDSQPTKKQ